MALGNSDSRPENSTDARVRDASQSYSAKNTPLCPRGFRRINSGRQEILETRNRVLYRQYAAAPARFLGETTMLGEKPPLSSQLLGLVVGKKVDVFPLFR
jgi:hypothetical protein